MSRFVRLAAATALVAAAGLTVPAPAYAEACSSATGVTVVVDFHELGGDIEQGCVADQGTADDLFVAAGHTLQNVNGQAFVCRVDGLPTQEQESCARTPPADAYWGLWWSEGQSGSWTYSSQGAYSLDVPEGGSVALSWNGSSTRSAPGASPPQHETAEEPSEEPPEEPEPTRDPTTEPSQPPTSGGGGTSGGGATTSTEPTPSASASATPEPGERRGRGDDDPDDDPDDEKSDRGSRGDRDRDATEEPSADPTATPQGNASDDPATVAEPPASGDDSALPVWVGPTAVGGLLAVAGVATYLRRRMS